MACVVRSDLRGSWAPPKTRSHIRKKYPETFSYAPVAFCELSVVGSVGAEVVAPSRPPGATPAADVKFPALTTTNPPFHVQAQGSSKSHLKPGVPDGGVATDALDVDDVLDDGVSLFPTLADPTLPSASVRRPGVGPRTRDSVVATGTSEQTVRPNSGHARTNIRPHRRLMSHCQCVSCARKRCEVMVLLGEKESHGSHGGRKTKSVRCSRQFPFGSSLPVVVRHVLHRMCLPLPSPSACFPSRTVTSPGSQGRRFRKRCVERKRLSIMADPPVRGALPLLLSSSTCVGVVTADGKAKKARARTFAGDPTSERGGGEEHLAPDRECTAKAAEGAPERAAR